VDAVTHHVERRTSPIDMFEQLDFIYQPSRNAAADLEHYVDAFGAEPVFAIERFGSRVAMVRLTADSPGLLFAEHLAGLRFLASSGGRIFLLHDGWKPRGGTVIVLPDNEQVRWQFSR
jgi:hypothetical protein